MKKEFIYFFKQNGLTPIKIGKTSGKDINNRMSDLGVSCPYGYEVLGWIECSNSLEKEKELHKRFEKNHIRGEWFDISPEIVKMIISEHNKSNEDVLMKVDNWLKDGGDKNVILKIIDNYNKYLDNNNESNELCDKLNKIILSNNISFNLPVLFFFNEVIKIDNSFSNFDIKYFARIMTKLGYKSKPKKVNGIVKRCYVKI